MREKFDPGLPRQEVVLGRTTETVKDSGLGLSVPEAVLGTETKKKILGRQRAGRLGLPGVLHGHLPPRGCSGAPRVQHCTLLGVAKDDSRAAAHLVQPSAGEGCTECEMSAGIQSNRRGALWGGAQRVNFDYPDKTDQHHGQGGMSRLSAPKVLVNTQAAELNKDGGNAVIAETYCSFDGFDVREWCENRLKPDGANPGLGGKGLLSALTAEAVITAEIGLPDEATGKEQIAEVAGQAAIGHRLPWGCRRLFRRCGYAAQRVGEASHPGPAGGARGTARQRKEKDTGGPDLQKLLPLLLQVLLQCLSGKGLDVAALGGQLNGLLGAALGGKEAGAQERTEGSRARKRKKRRPRPSAPPPLSGSSRRVRFEDDPAEGDRKSKERGALAGPAAERQGKGKGPDKPAQAVRQPARSQAAPLPELELRSADWRGHVLTYTEARCTYK